MRSLAGGDAKKKPWDLYRESILEILGPKPTAQQVFELGSNLKRIFNSEERTRSQSDLSRGGSSWEILVVWYLNLIFWDTNVVAMCPRVKLLPPVVREAMTVKIKNVPTTKEADVIVIEVPTNDSTMQFDRDSIDVAIRENPSKTRVGVVQCKTNWNDNAQIPMLWNALYAAHDLKVQNVAIGVNGYSPSSFGRFTYAFATVPTNTAKNGLNYDFKPDSTAVVRVQGLTGGNYWGNPSISGVADSMSEYFGRNFGNVFEGGVQTHITMSLLSNPTVLDDFLNFNF